MYACLLYLVLFIGSVQAATIGGAFSTVIDTILYLFKWVNTAIVLIFLWERRDWILRVMGQQVRGVHVFHTIVNIVIQI